jgi:glyoxylase-like metal-dependent hydrolase (beta-lactamase superfamily II)
MNITRRQFIGSAALAAAGPSMLRSFAGAQQVPATKFEDIRGGVGIFTGQGGTIGWVTTSDGVIAVDSQFPATAQICIDGLRERSAKGIQMLINTHHHADHVGGNPAFRAVVKKIVQNERTAKYHKNTTTANAAEQAYADMTFGESWSTTLGAEKVWGRYYGAGHTGGDSVIIFEKANVVHMGDLLFSHMHPFIDLPNGASIESWIKVLAKVADDYKDATFISGHAKAGLPLTGSRADVLKFRDYLSAVIDHARKAVRARQSVEELAKTVSLPGFEDFATNGARLSLAAVLTTAHQELTAK